MPDDSRDATPPLPTTEQKSLAGTVARITYQNRDNGYAVAKLEPSGHVEPAYFAERNLVAVVGVMPGIEVGQTVELQGEWTRDPKFGHQFRAKSFKPLLPTGVKGIEVYLASGSVKGIGPVTARRIVERFGERTFEMLDAHPERLREVQGISGKTLKKILAGWRGATGDRELVTFLGDHGVSPTVAASLRKVYAENALAIVRANPYRLTTDVRGIGFQRADAIARKIGLPEDAPERLDAALKHVLESQADDGHTYQPRMRLETLAVELLKAPYERVAERLEFLIAQGHVATEVIEGETAVFMPELHAAEQRVAERLRHLLASAKTLPRLDATEALADFEQRTRVSLAPAQREAARTLAGRGMLILTGGPGTGKTTTVRAVIELFAMARLTIKMAAPTGRAARRLAETGKLPAETIHRLLNYQAPLGRFGRDAANPIEADLVIVDEASMLDVPLAAHLLEALSPRTCLLLVGDEDQLPSVGPGNVLGDLLASGAMPVVRLTEIFRQAGQSLIVQNAHRINHGQMPLLELPESATNSEIKNQDFFFIEREHPPEIVATIKTLLRERIPRKFHLDPFRDVQVLSPMRRGELGVESLNTEIKKLLNAHREMKSEEGENNGEDLIDDAANVGMALPARESRFHFAFDPGDRVMQTSNNYDKLVFNGDIGFVDHADPQTREVLVQFEGRAVSYLSDELDQLTLAYATTIHKSQGSEYPAVIIPIHTQHWIMLQRNLIYTAMTRARQLVCLVGTRAALARAVKNGQRARRFTALRHFLAKS